MTVSPQTMSREVRRLAIASSTPGCSIGAVRRTRNGRDVLRTLWSRILPALQLQVVFQSAVERQLRRTRNGGITINFAVVVLG